MTELATIKYANVLIGRLNRSKLESQALNTLHSYGITSFDTTNFTTKDYVLAKNFIESKTSKVTNIRGMINNSIEMLDIQGIPKSYTYAQKQKFLSKLWGAFSDFVDLQASNGIAYASNQIIEEANSIVQQLGKGIKNISQGEILANIVSHFQSV